MFLLDSAGQECKGEGYACSSEETNLAKGREDGGVLGDEFVVCI